MIRPARAVRRVGAIALGCAALGFGCSGEKAPNATPEPDTMELPHFKYHPDPIATGSIVKSDATCIVCERARGYIYAAGCYSLEEYEECICPWCIADGSAADKLDATFFDESGVGFEAGSVPPDLVHLIATQTPGFSGWQQERWWGHCNQPAAFIGHAGEAELVAAGPEALQVIRDNTGIEDDGQWADFLSALDADGSPTAYLFRCVECGKLGGYQDCH